ncbi:glycosyltransferase family 2 protein [Evansella cellulosilytica]|uniref:Glycosyl transferase family 2 n=1 Tax=Evansella cellulosilytica (strain ATCC 21833 / DSM 2522 / FERM P-1141 / JCM 9156 / N-4) TaxID=649639 RepID=E6TUD8_EVAC2|nr:glycosyltransferase [Evansella cellulosilytica]ADU29694.1 glycosyl transferase family 2 [Evansella cellulosilytica DSM 2522]
MFLQISLIFVLIFVIFQTFYMFIPLLTIKGLNKYKKVDKENGVSILIPAYNEEKVILNCLQGIVNLNYNNVEAIFINDGSTDRTLDILTQHLQLVPVYNRLPAVKIPHEAIIDIYASTLYPKVLVIDKKNGGKADALNAGIEYARKEYVVTLDADSILDKESLHVINSTFSDNHILAIGGMVQIGQGFQGNYLKPRPTFINPGIIRFQILQYFTAFYMHKYTQSKLKSITVIAGAFGAFRRKVLFEVDGFRKTIGEDMDITLKIQRLIKTKYKNHRLIFVPQALCYTECPETFRALFNQRVRWQKAFVDCFFMYRKNFFHKLGVRLSLFFLGDGVLLGTINAFTALLIPLFLIFNRDHYMVALGLFTITFILGIFQSIATIEVSKRLGIKYTRMDYLRISLFIPLEIVTYRLLGILFVTIGTFMFFVNKDKWDKANRTGTNYQMYEDVPLLENHKAM